MKTSVSCALFLILGMATGMCLPVRVLAWDDSVAALDLALAHSKGTEKLDDLHPFQRSRQLEVSTEGDTPPSLLALDKTDEEGKPASVALVFPPSVKRALVLLLPDAKAPTGIRPLVIPDDISSFPWGSVRLVNTTGRELLFTWEKKYVAVPSGWKPVEIEPGGANRNMEVKVYLRDDPETAIYSAVWEQREELRSLVFISPSADESRGTVEFKFIVEDKRVAVLEQKAATN